MIFTKRQSQLLDRIDSLLLHSQDLPCPIIEAWGGGSLFRLEPAPKDADCVFRFEHEHRLWDWFRGAVETADAEVAASARELGLHLLPECDQRVLNWWIDNFSWSDLRNYGVLSSIAFLPERLTRRIIKRHYPGISVVELTKASNPTAWRMRN